MHILIPGRHHLLTDFQFKYLYRIIQSGLQGELDVEGRPLGHTSPVESVIFAVTSANHANTRRNPVPFYLRAMAILDFAQELQVPCYVYPIDDVGMLEDFAGYTLKKIQHESDGAFRLSPSNTVVACSTPVLLMYERKGFPVLPVELADRQDWRLRSRSPWQLVEDIASSEGPLQAHPDIFAHLHQASFLIWDRYGLADRVRRLFSDDMIGADGDLTESRDYNSYVREMDDIALMKYQETAPHLRPGRIGDIGCAVGTWIQYACMDERLRESDFFGIEVAFRLYRICLQRKENGAFPNPYVFFAQKNAVTGLCFDPASMNTIHTSSLTHEIESYGGRAELLAFIDNRYQEIAPGGVWVNRDVLGPDQPHKQVLLWLNDEDGENEDWEQEMPDKQALKDYLGRLSTKALFQRFARDFRRGETGRLEWEWATIEGRDLVRITLGQAMEFISKKDYHSNWQSEMHETFCYWSFDDWKTQLEKAGFTIAPASHSYTNAWLVENRYRGRAELFEETEGGLQAVPYPVTHMLMVAEKRI